MAVEDTDALDNSRHNSISKQQQEIIWHWQMFYDDTVNPPIPWWYNSVTGESTWECPVNREETIAKESVGLFSTPTAGELDSSPRSSHHLRQASRFSGFRCVKAFAKLVYQGTTFRWIARQYSINIIVGVGIDNNFHLSQTTYHKHDPYIG